MRKNNRSVETTVFALCPSSLIKTTPSPPIPASNLQPQTPPTFPRQNHFPESLPTQPPHLLHEIHSLDPPLINRTLKHIHRLPTPRLLSTSIPQLLRDHRGRHKHLIDVRLRLRLRALDQLVAGRDGGAENGLVGREGGGEVLELADLGLESLMRVAQGGLLGLEGGDGREGLGDFGVGLLD